MASRFGATIIPFGVVGEDDICDVSVYLKNMLLYFDILSIYLMYRNNVMLSHTVGIHMSLLTMNQFNTSVAVRLQRSSEASIL